MQANYLQDIDPSSKLYSILSSCIAKNEPYNDPEFPPCVSSICKDPTYENYKDYEETEWLRPEAIFKRPDFKLFDKIDPNDIQQGYASDCYFLSTCSAIAEFPERVCKIFLNKTENPFGVYSFIFYIQGYRTEVVIDDRIPYLRGVVLFTKPVGPELWVMLLEKAWAKVFGSYTAMNMGMTHAAMQYLMGYLARYITDSDKEFKDKVLLANMLRDADKKDYLMCAGSVGDSDKDNKEGVVCAHSYTIISVYDKFDDVILKMRNPWGSFEWKGKYSEDAEIWNQHEDLKKEFGVVKADDGVFFMTIDEFVTMFDSVYICYYEKFEEEDRRAFLIKSKSACYFELDVVKESYFQIGLHQKLKQFAEAQGMTNFVYSTVDLELFKIDDKIIECLAYGDSWKNDGAAAIRIKEEGGLILTPGRYLIRGKVNWNETYFTSPLFDGFTLTIVSNKGSYKCTQMENVNGRSLMNKFYLAYAKKTNKQIIQDKKAWYSMIGFPEEKNGEVPRVYIMCVGNDEENKVLNTIFTLKNIKNLRKKKEKLDGDKKIYFELESGKEGVQICKVLKKGTKGEFALDVNSFFFSEPKGNYDKFI